MDNPNKIRSIFAPVRAWVVALVSLLGLVALTALPGATVEPRDTSGVCPANEIPDSGFEDLRNWHPPAESAAECVIWAGLMEGTSPTTYSPARNASRAHVALAVKRLMAKAVELPIMHGQLTGAWQGDPALAAGQLATLGIVNATSYTARPQHEPMSRVEAALIVHRSLKALGVPLHTPLGDSPFNDLDHLPATTRRAVNELATVGAFIGTADGVFAPSEDLTRSQLALVLSRMLAIVGYSHANAPSVTVPGPVPLVPVVYIPTTLPSVTVPTTAAFLGTRPTFTGDIGGPLTYHAGAAITPVALPRATGGDGAITYGFSQELPAGLSFDQAAHMITGVPTAASPTRTYTFTAGDSDSDTSAGDTDSRSVTITVSVPPTEDYKPRLDNVAFDSLGTLEGAHYLNVVPWQMPEAHPEEGETVAGNSPLKYSLTPALPEGLSFDPATRQISGIPADVPQTTPDPANPLSTDVIYTYTVTDDEGTTDTADDDTDSFTFRIYVVDSTDHTGSDLGITLTAAPTGTPGEIKATWNNIQLTHPRLWGAALALGPNDTPTNEAGYAYCAYSLTDVFVFDPPTQQIVERHRTVSDTTGATDTHTFTGLQSNKNYWVRVDHLYHTDCMGAPSAPGQWTNPVSVWKVKPD